MIGKRPGGTGGGLDDKAHLRGNFGFGSAVCRGADLWRILASAAEGSKMVSVLPSVGFVSQRYQGRCS
jgi:hypothetical protein